MKIKRIRNGIILISIGVVLLLNNLGQVEWSVWGSILRLWPVFLIAWGIELIFRNTKLYFLTLFSPLLWGLAILGPALLGWSYDWEFSPLAKEHIWQVESKKGVKEVMAVIDLRGGELEISGGCQNIVDCDLAYFWEKPECRWEIEDSSGIVEIEAQDKIWFPFFRGSKDYDWRICFNDSLPLNLQIFSKVSAADLDLSKLNLRNLDLDLKVNHTEVKFPSIKGELECKVKSKIGNLKFLVPKKSGLRIESFSKLSNSSFSDISLTQDENGFKTPDYEKAASKIHLILKGKIVNFEVETY